MRLLAALYAPLSREGGIILGWLYAESVVRFASWTRRVLKKALGPTKSASARSRARIANAARLSGSCYRLGGIPAVFPIRSPASFQTFRRSIH